MPPVLAAAAAVVGAISAGAAAISAAAAGAAFGAGLGAATAVAVDGLVYGAIMTGLEVGATFVLSTASQLLEGKPPIGGSQVDFIADPQTGVPYLMGRTGTGGKIVMVDSAGTNSVFLTYVTVDSLGPVASYESFQANTILVQFSKDNGEGANTQNATTSILEPLAAGQTVLPVGSTNGFVTNQTVTIGLHTYQLTRVDQSPKELTISPGLQEAVGIYTAVTGPAVTSGFINRMWLKEQLGGANAPYLTFASTDSKDTPANHSGIPTVWTASCQLSGLAATMWTLEYDAQVYSGGTPRPLRVLHGVYCYDPRLDSTYPGGAGACRSNDETTWVYSENPYIHAITWLIGRRSNGVKTMGVHVPIASIDMAAFVAGANVADANKWTMGGVVDSTTSKWDILVAMLQAGGGTPLKLGAKISCMVNTPLVSLDVLTGADVVGKASIANTTPSRDRINAVWPRYREEQQSWQIVPTQAPVIVADYVTVDGGQRTKEFEYSLVQSATQASVLARYDIENAREIQPISLPCKPRWMGYKPGDCITINEPEYGLVNQTVLITSREVDPATLTTTLGFRTETAAKHAFALGTTNVAPVTPTMNGFDPSVFAQPGQGAWTAVGASIASGAQSVPVINISGASDNALAASVIFEYGPDGADDWQTWIEAPASSCTGTQITGLAPGSAYEVGVRYRSVKGVISNRTVILGGATTGAGSYGAHVGDGTEGDPGNLLGPDGNPLSNVDVVTSLGTSANTSAVGILSVVQVEQMSVDVSALKEFQTDTGVAQAAIDAAVADVTSANTALEDQLRAQAFAGSVAAINQAMQAKLLKDATFVQGQKPNAFAQSTQTIAQGSADLLSETLVSNPSGTGGILRDDNVTLDSTGATVASTFVGLSAADATAAATVTEETSARVAGDTANASATEALAATVGANKATYDGFVTAQADTNSALVGDYNSLNAVVGSNFSSFEGFVATQTTTNTSQATDVSNLSSDFNNYRTAASTTFTTLGDVLGAISNYDVELRAYIDDPAQNPLAATVSVQGAAVATATGQLYGSYGYTVGAGGAVSGMRAYASTGAVNVSGVVFEANAFLIEASPGSGVGISPLFYDATIGRLRLQFISIQGGDIQGGALAGTVGFDASISSTLTTSLTLLGPSLTINSGLGADIIFSCFFYIQNADPSNVQDVTCQLYQDGLLIDQKDLHITVANQNDINFPLLASGISGSHTYQLGAKATPGTGGYCVATEVALTGAILFRTGL